MSTSNSSDKSEALHAALVDCERSISGGRYAEAARHLRNAERLGADPDVVRRHEQEIQHKRSAGKTRRGRAPWWGFAVAVAGYLILSLQQPAGWGEALWAALALLAVPAVSGFVANRAQAGTAPTGGPFFSAARGAGAAMLLYSAITLAVLAQRVGRPDGGTQVLLAGAIVTTVYTMLAGAIAGLVNVVLTRNAAGKATHGASH